MMTKTRVLTLATEATRGLGGRAWTWGVEAYLRADARGLSPASCRKAAAHGAAEGARFEHLGEYCTEESRSAYEAL